MVNYKCIRCGYDTNHKSKMTLHFSRKNICKPILNDVILDDYKKDILNGKIVTISINDKKTTKTNKNEPKNNQNEPKFKKNEPKNNQNEPKINQNDKLYKCEFCKKKYKHIQSLNKHKKYRCKEKIRDDKCKQDMMELVNKLNDQLNEQKKQLSKRDKQIDELIKKTGINIGTQNIQNNIKILAYKNTDLSHLTDQDYIYCFNRSNMCIPHLIKRIHFNPKKPENHNVYISNIKNKYIMIYDGIKWNLQNQDDAIDDIMDSNEYVLEQKLEEWIENGKDYPDIMNKFNRYLEKKEKDNVINKVKDEIKLILFNNRKVINEVL
jgi:DNA-directed RNA polymerase subunit RPC12/RpoP